MRVGVVARGDRGPLRPGQATLERRRAGSGVGLPRGVRRHLSRVTAALRGLRLEQLRERQPRPNVLLEGAAGSRRVGARERRRLPRLVPQLLEDAWRGGVALLRRRCGGVVVGGGGEVGMFT